MSFFISDVMAAAPTTHAQADGTFSLIMIVAIFVLFYFMLIRPQNKRAKEHREMVSKLKKGDEIITSGGILAKVVNLDDQYIKVALAENIEITVQRSAVSAVLPKGTLKSL
ncbi:preprotein translocase subunit YajC [Legionella clemsonensis]|uniref:Sec translocon accessory complex subunit YajC n=1 Tax=Legionella clemsonensis TaxID=1867846 RepID=A0A222P409_9GAMM|nr:preprotein translocase subunit YajC [Legionella clemsonensis]ASQ46569.1 preprotein translocase subunit YajC [Legionella clemsonensis]